MDLNHYLKTRAVILAGDRACLPELKRLDRQFLVAVRNGRVAHPLLRGPLSDRGALVSKCQASPERFLLLLEARERLEPGTLCSVQRQLLDSDPCSASTRAWCRLAAPNRVLHALAMWRRKGEDLLADPWRQWVAALEARESPLALANHLWARFDGENWEDWLPMLAARCPLDETGALINSFLPRLPKTTLIMLMGITGDMRFLPWLEPMAADPELAGDAGRERRWLLGDHFMGDPRSLGRRAWWGRALEDGSLQELFATVPLPLRQRLWLRAAEHIEGVPDSLQGGRWCTGN